MPVRPALTLRCVLMSIKARAEYRIDFLSSVVVGVVWQVSTVVFATVLITRFPGMGGWAPGEVLLIVAVRMTGHALAVTFFTGVRQVPQLVREGRIDAFLLRPLQVYRQARLSYFHVPVIGDLVVASVLLAAALTRLGAEWTPWRLGYLLITLAGATLLEASIQTFLGGFALLGAQVSSWQNWTEDLMESFGNYPLQIFPGPAREVFVVVLPIAFGCYLPVAVLTGHGHQAPVPYGVAVAAPAVSLGLYIAARRWWSICLRRYESVGG